MRITILNLFYPPNLAPSAHLTASLADHRADPRRRGDGGRRDQRLPRRFGARPAEQTERRYGPRVIRLWTPASARRARPGDSVTTSAYLLGAIGALLVLPRQDVVIALTSPPFILVAAAVAHRLLHPRHAGHPLVTRRVPRRCRDVRHDPSGRRPLPSPAGDLEMAAPTRGPRRGRRSGDAASGACRLARETTSPRHRSSRPGSHWPSSPVGTGPHPWEAYEDPDLAGTIHRPAPRQPRIRPPHRHDRGCRGRGRRGGRDLPVRGRGGAIPGARAEAARRHRREHPVPGYVPKEQTPAVLAGADCALISLDDRSIGIMSPSKMNAEPGDGPPRRSTPVRRAPTSTRRSRSTTAGSRCGRATSRDSRTRSGASVPIRISAAKLSTERTTRVRGDSLRSERPRPIRRACSTTSRVPGRDPCGIG